MGDGRRMSGAGSYKLVRTLTVKLLEGPVLDGNLGPYEIQRMLHAMEAEDTGCGVANRTYTILSILSPVL